MGDLFVILPTVQVWEERAVSALRGIAVICQVAEAARRNSVGGTRSAQLMGLAWRAVSCLAPTSFKKEEVHSFCNIYLHDSQN